VLLCLHVNVESRVHVESQLSIEAEDEKSVEKNEKAWITLKLWEKTARKQDFNFSMKNLAFKYETELGREVSWLSPICL